MIHANKTILFQGDSITDVNRSRVATEQNEIGALGCGYVNHISCKMLRDRPADKLRFLNRGISGNRIVDLYARWKVDAINLAPDVISILIGVNDTWHEFGSQNGVEPDRYETVYRMLLSYTRQKLPAVEFILCEPFVLKCGVVQDTWLADMAARREIVKNLAGEFGASFVRFQSAFDKAAKLAPPEYWLRDGVHPSPAGHWLMAETWIDTVT